MAAYDPDAPVDNTGTEEVVVVDTPDGPTLAVAMTIGPSAMEHAAWLHQRYATDDGLGYNRQALARNPTTRRLAELR